MKKLRLTLLVMLIFAGVLKAQDQGTKGISVGAGFYTTNEILNTFEDIANGASFGNVSAGPAISITYKVAIKDRWFVYADAAYQSISEDIFLNGNKEGDVSHRFFTVGFGTEYHYVSGDLIQAYSGISIAYTSQTHDYTLPPNSVVSESSNDNYVGFQVNALGIRVGRKLAGFLELGFGYRGVANVGLSYQF